MSNYNVILADPPIGYVSLKDIPIGKYAVIMSCEGDNESYIDMIVIRHTDKIFTTVCGKMWDAHHPKVNVRMLKSNESFTVNVL